MAVLVYILLSVIAVKNVVASFSLSGSADHAAVQSPFTFTCNTSRAVSGISWNTDGSSFSVYQDSGTSCNTASGPADYRYSCTGGIIYTLAIPSVNFSKHGSKWLCEGIFGGRQSSEITLKVYVPLTTTSMTTRPASVVSGVTNVLQCSTNPCYPNAAVIWTQYKCCNENNISITTGVTTDTEYIADSGVITRSNLTRSYTWADHEQQIVCSATSDGTTKSSPPLQLVIWVQVAMVTFLNMSSQNEKIGASEGFIKLVCVTSPSNPAPTVSWYKNGQRITSGVTDTPGQNSDGLSVTTSYLLVVVNRSDNGQTVYCMARIQGQTTRVRSSTGILDVW
ncbi:nephrin-like, partial [Gigantopelta aegis]|uniref:nephrin-like n=1 Tax=Gigantopelta aegis TaxID=1735272 RepID=UPI001B88DD8C